DVTRQQASDIAQSYFEFFMVAQFLAVVLLTPAYVGGAIAEEKDRKTLEFMLATDLLNREIVLSKLGSRLGNLALIVLTGLPILSVLQFLGGVDPNLVLAGFVVTVMTIFGQAGVSILCSVTARRPRDAISLAYLAGVLYYVLVVTLMMAGTTTWGTSVGAIPIWFGGPPMVADAVRLFNAGSLIAVIRDVKIAGSAGTLATVLPGVVRDYTLVQGAIGLGCTALAVARLRRVALAQTYGTSIKARSGLRLRYHPPIGPNPMLWKELHCESGGRTTWIGW